MLSCWDCSHCGKIKRGDIKTGPNKTYIILCNNLNIEFQAIYNEKREDLPCYQFNYRRTNK